MRRPVYTSAPVNPPAVTRSAQPVATCPNGEQEDKVIASRERSVLHITVSDVSNVTALADMVLYEYKVLTCT